MSTSTTCALSGAFLLAGGFAGVMWVFLRSLALHLQICWQVVIGNTFMWGALAAGWGIPGIALTVSLVFSGVSFRFGDTCHINHDNSLADFWIPLLVFAGITVVIQFATFGYCIKVYLASLADDSTTTNSSGLPSYTNSIRGTISPRQAYRRVRRVIELQWRGIAIVLLIIADVIFFAVIFVFMDNNEATLLKDPLKSQNWLVCLIENNGVKDKCLNFASSLVVNEATVMAVLILLSVG
jgi:7 transmembrane receptor (Secretin family)